MWLVALGTVSLRFFGLKWTLFLEVGALIVIVCIRAFGWTHVTNAALWDSGATN